MRYRLLVVISIYGLVSSQTVFGAKTPSSVEELGQMISSSNLSAVWVNEGGDKVTQDELRATNSQNSVTNSVWNGSTIILFGAKNEVISFNVILEAATKNVSNISVTMSNLNGPSGSVIRYNGSRGSSGIYNWTSTEAEIFYIRYLQITGLSQGNSYGCCQTYQEANFPHRAQCASGTGCAWATRPVANKYYPDITVPIELINNNFTISSGNNQSIWVDIYIPKTVSNGSYTGTFSISENGTVTHTLPINLTVRNFTLPDAPCSKTMVAVNYNDISQRYTGTKYPNNGDVNDTVTKTALQNHRLVAHRHKISLIDDDGSWSQGFTAWATNPSSDMTTALSGSLYTTTNGYAGPGYNTGNDVYSIGTYGAWQTSAWTNSQASFETNTDGWEQWFETNYPNIERFVYLCDEDGCNNTPTLTTMLGYMSNVTGVRKNLHTMATQPLHCVVSTTLSDPTSQWPYGDGTSGQNQTDANTILGSEPTRRLFAYGTNRPGTGSTALEDEGVAMRELPWSQYKKSVDRWFVWEGTNYYNTYALTNTNVFVTATTFGNPTTNDPSYGLIGGSGSNGNGVLFYPGTDYYYPSYNYGVTGPIASIRLKEWRRGIQDVDYIILAKAINPSSVSTIVSNMVPNALWENVCGDPPGCTYYTRDTTWSYNPNDWESARSQLAHIIDGQ